MANFRFISRYSIANLDFVVINDLGTQVAADTPPTVTFRNYATGAQIWQRATTLVTAPGTYRVTVSSAESGTPGLFYIDWTYTIGAVAQAYGVFIEEAGIANRATFVINKDGELVAKFVTAPGQARSLDEYDRALASL